MERQRSRAFLLLLSLVLLAPLGASAPRSGRAALVQEAPAATPLELADRLYALGVADVRRGDYAQAAQRFESALESGGDALAPDRRARVLRARGNCAFRQGDALEASGWYEAALRLDPADDLLRQDLELARSDAGLPPRNAGDLASTFALVRELSPPEAARRQALLGAVVLALALLVELWRGGRVAKAAVALALLFAAGMAVPWLLTFGGEREAPHLVLRNTPVPIRSEPRPDLPAVGHLEPAATVTRVDALEGWIRIEDGDLRGWVPEDALFVLER